MCGHPVDGRLALDGQRFALGDNWRLAAVWRLAAGGDWRLALGGDWRLVLGGRLEKLVISHQPPQNDPLFVYLGLFSTSLDLFFAGFALKLFPMQKCQVLVG